MKTFAVEQRLLPFANQYYVYNFDKFGKKGELLAFAHQKRLALREKFTFYTDQTKKDVLFEVQARKVIDLGARYDIRDKKGEVIGVLGKDFKASFFRSTWHIFASSKEDKPLLVAYERSKPLAILRRLLVLIPYGDEVLPFLKYHFDFYDAKTQKKLAEYNKTTTVRDHYRLQVQDEALEKVDWRVLVALGIMMDAIQGR